MQKKYGIYEDKIGIMGFSAGGHLACICAEMLINSNMNLLMI